MCINQEKSSTLLNVSTPTVNVMNDLQKRLFGLDRCRRTSRRKRYLKKMWLYPSKHHPTSHVNKCIIEEKYLWKTNFDHFLLAALNFYLQEHREFGRWNILTWWSKWLCCLFRKSFNVRSFCRNLRKRTHQPVRIHRETPYCWSH